MPEPSIEDILKQLRTRDPHEAWIAFLQEYSALIFQVTRYHERDLDLASDCFQFVCERLCADRFRRLLRFNLQGAASFSTWLRAVVRNLCIDWRRKEFGRHRPFRFVTRLNAFDQEVFRSIYERGNSTEETFFLLQSAHPEVTLEQVTKSRERIEQELTAKQRWVLSARSAQKTAATIDETSAAPFEIPDPRPDPEARAVIEERRGLLSRALARLPTRERLLVRLRFEQGLTLEQIAKLLDLGNAQRADRQLKDILARLREDLK
jgi:RNA polymerase sigma factor (sigma-70 family)